MRVCVCVRGRCRRVCVLIVKKCRLVNQIVIRCKWTSLMRMQSIFNVDSFLNSKCKKKGKKSHSNFHGETPI